MTRLAATVLWDLRLQWRNGFYYASAFVATISVVLFHQLNLAADTLALLLPAVIMQNILINTFYFIAGLVLLEKGEGTLEGLVVSPLRRWEYLLSKLLTLVWLSVLESAAIVLVVFGPDFNPLLLAAGVGLMGALFALLGFVAVARYDSINTFLLPSVLMTILFSIPLLDYFGLWQSGLMYLHPIQASLLLLKGAFQPLAGWHIVYGLLYSALWIGLIYAWAQRAFYRFIILKEGVH